MSNLNYCDWMSYSEYMKLRETNENITPLVFDVDYNDDDVLIYTSFINPENEQKIIYWLGTQKDIDQDQFERDFCIDTNQYHDWTSEYTEYMKKIKNVLGMVGYLYMDDEDYIQKKKEIESIILEYNTLMEKAMEKAYYTDHRNNINISEFY